MEKLSVKGRYIYKNGEPFFILADTAWLLYDKLNDDEIELYYKNRKGLGFNTILAVAVYSDPRFETQDGMPHGNKNVNDAEYWRSISRNIDLAERYGLYVGLLPAWGSFVKNGYLNCENAQKYADFLGRFFKDKTNLFWVLGGDVRGDTNFEVFDTLGKTLKEHNPERLITFHPFGRTGSYQWFNDCNWLDFNTFQSGHRRYDQIRLGAWDDKALNEDAFGEDNWRYVVKNFSFSNVKPCMDAEPSYEGIVQGLHDETQPYWEARDVRRYAYWSVFEGACGFTYGNNAVIQFYRDGEKRAYGVRETWSEGLHSCGGAQMVYLKELIESVDFANGLARPEHVLNQGEKYHRTSVFAGRNYVLCYNFCGDEIALDLKTYAGRVCEAFWINPENGNASYMGEFECGGEALKFKPTARHELSNDWVLKLKFN
ncbi:MAG: DUF4038 domain-containing protein [Candidatus Coproplasma sp.]